jgi:hypothetical protein
MSKNAARASSPQDEQDEQDARPTGVDTAVLRSSILIGGVTFLLISAFFLLNVGGLGAAASLPGDWLAQFGGGGLDTWLTPLLAIIRYEIPLLVVGLAAILWAARRSQALPMFAVYWLIGVLLLLMAQQGVIGNAAIAVLPLYLLIGAFSGAVIGPRIDWRGWLLTGGLLLLWALMFVNSGRFLRQIALTPTDLSSAWIALFALAFALTTIFFAIGWDARATYQGVLLSLLLMLLFYNWGTAWWLGHAAANDPRETWVSAGTDAGLPEMERVLRDLSWQFSQSDQDVDILSAVDTPALRWYLRDYVNVDFGKTASPNTTATIVITAVGDQSALGESYMGADYAIARSAPENVASTEPVLDTLRWWLFHQSPSKPEQERVILWVKSETAP